ncbi:MAG: UspA domain protein [Chitinophagaceae bacterium]|nr:UspA domain protein [Chitinophagaceae bacterium]
MRTILIPVDFSSTSFHAIHFAAEWSKKYEYGKIILLKTFYESMLELLIVSEGYSQVNQDLLNEKRAESEKQLEEMRIELVEKTGIATTVETRVSELPLLRSILEVIEEEPIELIVVGSGNDKQGSNFIAGHIIGIAKLSPVKVLIVPAGYDYHTVEKVLVPCDRKTLMTLDKLARLKNDARLAGAKLLVLNVDKEGPSIPDEKWMEVEENAHSFLKDFPHEIHHVTSQDVISGILSFSESHKTDLIIALPGKHSFLYYLTNKSISEAIYKNARQPVLILK